MHFNPRAPRGARLAIQERYGVRRQFQSTRPARGATHTIRINPSFDNNFNPRAPRGARHTHIRIDKPLINFNPRAPRGARLEHDRLAGLGDKDFNPRAPRGARHYDRRNAYAGQHISIHAPREGRDDQMREYDPDLYNFNPRAPRGARLATSTVTSIITHFNPRAPRGARRRLTPYRSCIAMISIHAPREGRDDKSGSFTTANSDFNPRAPRGARQICAERHPRKSGRFQSTRPARGATQMSYSPLRAFRYFNPRAPRGARPVLQSMRGRLSHFNPRAPRGARHKTLVNGTVYEVFQSTRPARGATQKRRRQRQNQQFQSTRPARGATSDGTISPVADDISIHAPREGRDSRPVSAAGSVMISIHAPREGRDHHFSPPSQRPRNFNPRAPRGARLCFSPLFRRCCSSFQSTRPARGATAKVNKFLCTFLQKRHGFQISLRKTLPFKAFCRLQIGKNFSICGANRCGNFCELLLRTIRSSVLPEGRSACSQNAQFYSHTFSRDNRNADCLFPGP